MASRRPTSSTGDLQNNLEKLRYELLRSKYTGPLDVRVLKKGSPVDLLPLVHFALLGFSKYVHDALVAAGYDLFAKTDIRFMEAVYKLLRAEFDYQPQLRVDQFFCDGFVERKIIFVHEVLKLCQIRHIELKRGPASAPIKKDPSPPHKPPEIKASQQEPLVERHGRSVSISSRCSYSDNDADLVPRPEAPTPLHASLTVKGMCELDEDGEPRLLPLSTMGAMPVSILSERAMQQEPVIIQGGGGPGYDDVEDEDYGEEDDWEDTNDRGRYGMEDSGREEDLFVPRKELAQRTQHAPMGGCHNDALVLRMSESMLVLVNRVEELEDKVDKLERIAIMYNEQLQLADKRKEEAEAQSVLAASAIQMLERRVNGLECLGALRSPRTQQARADTNVEESSAPALGMPYIRSHLQGGSLDQGGAIAARNAAGSPPPTITTTSQDPPQRREKHASAYHTVEAPHHMSATSEMSRSGHSCTSSSKGQDLNLESFIASITNRFKETNELLSKSKEAFKRREAPATASHRY